MSANRWADVHPPPPPSIAIRGCVGVSFGVSILVPRVQDDLPHKMLTDILIRNVKTSRKLYDQRGLYLLVSPQGGKWWRFKYRFAGKEKLLSLGTYPDVSLARARSCREDMRKLVAAGIDPSQKRKADKANLLKAQGREPDSLESVAREWFGKMTSAWAPSHGKEVIRRLERDVFPILGTKPIDEIGEPELLAMLRRIEARGVIETAHRINQICGQVFKYAIAAGKATRNPSISLRGAL
ncbi:MAG TPA: integrase arm-type DNA-binding domain-containing protein, partial [Candidatus Binataceae bacterium]|nr:integrase arm-type DNA-binding domain-containing protein [Candidatus Binataceae bacterium]